MIFIIICGGDLFIVTFDPVPNPAKERTLSRKLNNFPSKVLFFADLFLYVEKARSIPLLIILGSDISTLGNELVVGSGHFSVLHRNQLIYRKN